VILQPRRVLDVSELPDTTFGPRDVMWWGTLGFVLIEGFTLVLCAVVLVYLHQNFSAWPPAHTLRPSLGWPTVNLVLMLGSIPLIAWMRREARVYDFGKVRLALTVAAALNLAFVLVRALELLVSLNVKWDTNAYGSAQWLVLGTHATLLAVELVEVAGMAAIFWLAPVEKKHFSDAADMGFYWYFMVLSWVPLYVLSYLLPRWI
jgi:heme/copper-type cytochrome/quinol oxidase subunit 3